MRHQSLLVFLLLVPWTSGVALAAPANSSCERTNLQIQRNVVQVHDRFLRANVHGPKFAENVALLPSGDVLKGRRIIAVQPTYSGIFLSDGSAIALVRNVDGDGSVKSAQYFPTASCWSGSGWGTHSYPRSATEVVISDYPQGTPRISIRLEKLGKTARISRVASVIKTGKRIERGELLILTNRPVDALGVSLPPIDGRGRVLMLVTREKDGSLTIAGYHLD